jgi:hypothetical protein
MIPQDYSISLSEASKTDSKTIFNIKLTEELVEKLMKGQQDLNNLKGIEFCISEQSNVRTQQSCDIYNITFIC